MKREVDRKKNEFLKNLGDDTVSELKRPITDWDHQPTFIVRIKNFTLEVDVKDDEAGDIWKWVTFGTGSRGGGKDITIRAKRRGGFLSFRLGYSPKTDGGSGKATGEYRRKKEVKSKGIKPRKKKLLDAPKRRVLKNTAGKFFKSMRKAIFRR